MTERNLQSTKDRMESKGPRPVPVVPGTLMTPVGKDSRVVNGHPANGNVSRQRKRWTPFFYYMDMDMDMDIPPTLGRFRDCSTHYSCQYSQFGASLIVCTLQCVLSNKYKMLLNKYKMLSNSFTGRGTTTQTTLTELSVWRC